MITDVITDDAYTGQHMGCTHTLLQIQQEEALVYHTIIAPGSTAMEVAQENGS